MKAAGAYFDLWTLATKPSLALAGGIALPLLSALGYAPDGRGGKALTALAVVYAFVPCMLQLGAIAAPPRFERSR